jgi:hypothetical protein
MGRIQEVLLIKRVTSEFCLYSVKIVITFYKYWSMQCSLHGILKGRFRSRSQYLTGFYTGGIFVGGGGDNMLALSWYHCAHKYTHTRGIWGLNLTTLLHAGDSSPHTHLGLLVHTITKILWANPRTGSWLPLASNAIDESNFSYSICIVQ